MVVGAFFPWSSCAGVGGSSGMVMSSIPQPRTCTAARMNLGPPVALADFDQVDAVDSVAEQVGEFGEGERLAFMKPSDLRAVCLQGHA